MLRRKGWHMDVVHHDLSINNWRHIIPQAPTITTDHGCVDMLQSSFMPPRRGMAMMEWWRDAYVRLVDQYIEQYGKPDIIHAHTYLGGWVALSVSDTLGIPIVLTEHYTGLLSGDISETHQEIMRATYPRVTQVLGVSQALADAISQQYGCDTRVIPNFINTHQFKLKNVKPADAKTVRLITVGDLIPRKQIDLLIDAVKITNGVSLTIIGDGPERGRLHRKVRDLGLTNQIELEGRLDQKAIAEKLLRHDIYVHPSKVETFGISLIEAMSCGLPAIAFDNGGSRDIITRDTGLIVTDQSPEGLRDAIQRVIGHWTDYDPEIIRQRVLDHFSTRPVEHQLYGLYQSLFVHR